MNKNFSTKIAISNLLKARLNSVEALNNQMLEECNMCATSGRCTLCRCCKVTEAHKILQVITDSELESYAKSVGYTA